jgi:hypothetical protein
MFAVDNLKRDRMSVAIYDPFFTFEFENIFDPDLYRQLDEQFPKKSEFSANWADRGGKFYMSSKMPEYKDLTRKAPIWAELYERFVDPRAIDAFYQLARSVPSERSSSETKPWRLETRPQRKGIGRGLVAAARALQSALSGYTPVRVVLEFSYLETECFIPPHTDVPSKLITLMICFPDKEAEYPVGTGTEFYRGKGNTAAEGGWKTGMLGDDATKAFFERHEVFHTSSFTPNKLVGFVKSSRSWHGVRPLALPPNVPRRSLNINYYLA